MARTQRDKEVAIGVSRYGVEAKQVGDCKRVSSMKSKEELVIAEVKRLSTNGKMPSMAYYEKNRKTGVPGKDYILKNMGRWHEVAKSAGLTRSGSRKTSSEDINKAVEFIKNMAVDGLMPKATEYNKVRGRLPHSHIVRERNGSWAELADSLGLKYQGRRRRSREEIHSRKGVVRERIRISTGVPVFDLIGTVFYLAELDVRKGYDHWADNQISPEDKKAIMDPKEFLEAARAEFMEDMR